jgi:hypothetical protein
VNIATLNGFGVVEINNVNYVDNTQFYRDNRIGDATGSPFVIVIFVGNTMSTAGASQSAHPTGQQVLADTAAQADSACARHGLPAICIGDPGRTSYRSMDLERTTWWRILLAPAALRRRRKEASAAGCSVSLSGTLQKHSDVLQLPGAAIIAKGGEIIWIHRGNHPGDLPLARELLDVIERTNPGQRRPSAN